MENLGLMEPEELLQLVVGSLACAIVIFALLIGYVVITRRGKKTSKPASPSTPSFRQSALSAGYHERAGVELSTSAATPSGPAAPATLSGDQAASIDVSARLAGTGRAAWLEETAPPVADVPPAGAQVAYQGREVLRLVRDASTGQVWVQVAGVRYRSLTDIRDRAVGERVLAAITHVLRFSNAMVATDQGVQTLQLPPCGMVKVPTAFGALSETHEPGEVLRLMSDPERGLFCVHVAGHCYQQLAEVTDWATGQSILEAITRLLQFSHGMLATDTGLGTLAVPSLRADAHTPLPAPPPPSPQPAQVAPVSPALPEPAPGPQSAVLSSSSPELLSEQERFLRQLMQQMPAQPQAPLERPSLMTGIRRMRKKSADAPLPTLNLAEEINRIFQSKLLASGRANTDAQVESKPDGGVRIRVGTVCYDAPDEVPDLQLRDMLKLSIAEWERG